MIIQTTTFTVVFILLFSVVFAVDPCRFEDPERGVIDLTTLGRTDGKAAYADRDSYAPSGYRMLPLALN